MTARASHSNEELQNMATTLLMIGPSREFAAGVAALLVSAGAATPAMVDIDRVARRAPSWCYPGENSCSTWNAADAPC